MELIELPAQWLGDGLLDDLGQLLLGPVAPAALDVQPVAALALEVDIVQPLFEGRHADLRPQALQLAHQRVVGEVVAAHEDLADDADTRLRHGRVYFYRFKGSA